jgi:hypothetical protein
VFFSVQIFIIKTYFSKTYDIIGDFKGKIEIKIDIKIQDALYNQTEFHKK